MVAPLTRIDGIEPSAYASRTFDTEPLYQPWTDVGRNAENWFVASVFCELLRPLVAIILAKAWAPGYEGGLTWWSIYDAFEQKAEPARPS